MLNRDGTILSQSGKEFHDYAITEKILSCVLTSLAPSSGGTCDGASIKGVSNCFGT